MVVIKVFKNGEVHYIIYYVLKCIHYKMYYLIKIFYYY